MEVSILKQKLPDSGMNEECASKNPLTPILTVQLTAYEVPAQQST